MFQVSRVRVTGLFGYMEHDVRLRTEGPTILTGPNGSGKTHVLELVQCALSLNLARLMQLPFGLLHVWFADGRELSVGREVNSTDETIILRLSALSLGRVAGDTVVIGSDAVHQAEELPSFLVPLSNEKWLDQRSDMVLSRAQVERRYGVQLLPTGRDLLRHHKPLLAIAEKCSTIMIDTKRLDRVDFGGRLRPAETRRSPDRINEYIDEIRTAIVSATRESTAATQSADLSFAARALAVAKMTVREAELHKRYNEVVAQYEHLARNGMAIGEAPLPFPDETTPTVRRILKVFLDDWENRLIPLLPVNGKIQALRDVLDSKLAQSQKRTAMGKPQGRLTFRTFDNRVVGVNRLSSGEQHLVALFTLLLFVAKRGSIVLIDEPEISMHAAWKHAFIDDVSRVAELTDCQFLIATHSTAIINGRWDLTEELSFTPDPFESIDISDASDDESYDFVIE